MVSLAAYLPHDFAGRPEPTIEPEFGRALLDELDQVHLVAIRPDGPTQGRDFSRDVASALAWATERNESGENIYWTVNAVRPGVHRKPKKEDIAAARFVHVDIDPPKNGSAWSANDVLTRLAVLACAPSFVIDSGNGLQAFWRLVERVENWAPVERVNLAVRCAFDADACHNIDRLMRLPGFINYPDAKKRARGRVPVLATVCEPDDGIVYEVGQLTAAFPTAPDATKAETPELKFPKGSGPVGLLSPDELLPAPSASLRRLIEEADPDGRYGGDRSAQALGCVRYMVELGYSDQQIRGILLNPANQVAQHNVAQADAMRAVDREIAKARASAGAEYGQVATDQLVEPRVRDSEEARSISPSWMRGIGDGPLAEFVDAVIATSAMPQPELALGAALAVFGTLAGRRYVGPTGFHSNFYILGLLASGAGKDHPLKAAAKLLEQSGFAELLGGRKIASDAGLLAALVRSPTILFTIDEAHALMNAVFNERSGNHERAIAARMTELYSNAGEMWTGTEMAAGRTESIAHPHMCFMGISPKSTLFGGSINASAFSSGTMARFLIFEGDEMVLPNKAGLGKELVFSPEMVRAAKAMRALKSGAELPDGPSVTPTYQQVRASDAINDLYYEFMVAQVRRAQCARGDEAKAAILRRTAEQAAKIGMLRAITERPEDPEISRDSLEWAFNLALEKEALLVNILENETSENEYHRYLQKAENAIRKAGRNGATRTALSDPLKGCRGSMKEEVLRDLEQAGAIRQLRGETTASGGRPRTTYVHHTFVRPE